MSYKPHWRVQCSGVARTADNVDVEIFSWSFAVASQNGIALPTDLLSGDGFDACQGIAVACTDYWGDDNIQVAQSQVLTLIKIAPIGADGSYEASPFEEAHNLAGPLAVVNPYPLQIAYAVSLTGPAVLHPVRGRWYMPGPAAALDPATFAWNSARTDFAVGAAQDFLNAVNSAMFDVLPLSVPRACIASGKGAGTNAPIETVSVGSVLDTIRRRRNALPEARSVVTLDPPP